MSRPRPQRLLTAPAGDNIHTVEVIDIAQQWAVTYRGELVGLARQHLVGQPKYLRTTFQTAAPAYNLADKLNRLFKCQDFSAAPVVALGSTQGDPNMPQEKRSHTGGGQYFVNIAKATEKQAEVLDHGHIKYTSKDGTEQIRLNSKAFPTDNIRKTLKKT
jgi:hypothetical protein